MVIRRVTGGFQTGFRVEFGPEADMVEPKLCRHCRYYRYSSPYQAVNQGFGTLVPRYEHACAYEQKIDLVTGDMITADARQMRSQGGHCGLEGRLFESTQQQGTPYRGM